MYKLPRLPLNDPAKSGDHDFGISNGITGSNEEEKKHDQPHRNDNRNQGLRSQKIDHNELQRVSSLDIPSSCHYHLLTDYVVHLQKAAAAARESLRRNKSLRH